MDTQLNNQKFTDPFVAVVVSTIVLCACSVSSHHATRRLAAFHLRHLYRHLPSHPQIDPNRTVSAGRVDIGAFRTYPEGYTPPSSSGGGGDEYQSIPLSKIEDFGVHANQYYPLDVQIFKSSLDEELLGLLWNKYWVNTLSQSPLISVCFHFRLRM